MDKDDLPSYEIISYIAHSTNLRMIQKQFVFALSFFVIQISMNVVSAQVTFVHDQELIGEGSDDLFGWSVDLSGDGKTIIVGAIGNNGGFTNQGNKGQARVYRNTFNVSFNSWSWAMLGGEINGTAANVESGYDVSITNNGNTIAIGTPGQDKMRVYDLNVSNNWVQRGNDLSIFSSQSAQRAGHSVSINANGTVAAMGAPLANKVWVFNIDPAGGTGLMSGNPLVMPGTYAGGSVDIDDDGNTLVVGAYKSNTERGSVAVYDFNGTTWVQRGQTLSGVNNYDQFGFDVSMSNDGNTIAVGIKGWDSNPNNTTYEIGQTAVYDWNGSIWVQRGTSIQGVNIFDQCGFSVSLSGNGNRIAIGYKGNSTVTQAAGLVRIFDWDGSAWVQNGDPIYGDGISVYSGHSVALSDNGSILAIGAIQGTGPVNQFTNQEGQVRIYETVTVNPVYSFTENHSICFGDTYNWHGTNYTTANTYTKNYTTIHGCDSIYTLHLTVNPVYTFTENHSICYGETFNWHGTDYTAANTYTANYTSINGCDSIYTLNLTVNFVDTSLTVYDHTITANATGATYQWLDCDNSFVPIDGATLQSYTATANGNYAVAITQGLCSDTSVCKQIITIGIASFPIEGISIYPNPVSNELIIEIEGNNKNLNFEILNTIGQVVFKGNLFDKTTVQTSNFATGFYLIKFGNGKTFEFKKIIKE